VAQGTQTGGYLQSVMANALQLTGVLRAADMTDGWLLVKHLMEERCFVIWTICLMAVICLALVATAWWLARYVRSLRSQLEQCMEDLANLAGLFSSEIETLRTRLHESQRDSKSLDETLNTILNVGLSGHIELVSGDYWCVKMMDVTYTDKKQNRKTWRHSGYQMSCFIPVGASDIEVALNIVGGAPVWQVDRSKHNLPWVLDGTGNYKVEKFKYAKCPGHVRYKVCGAALHAFISHIDEMDMLKGESINSGTTGNPTVLSIEKFKASAVRECS